MHHVAKALGGASLVGGVAGAVIGGAVSAANQLKDVKEGKVTKEEAAKKAAVESASTGVSTAVGVAAAGLLRLGGVFGILTVFAVAAGTKYLIDSSAEKVCKSKCKKEDKA